MDRRWIIKGMIGLGVLFVLGAVVGLLLVNAPAANQPGGPARVGARIANFALTDLDGRTVRLSDYAGRPVLVNFWATWCPPCRAEMPGLNTFYQQHKAGGFGILAVNSGESRDLAGGFAQELGLSFPVLLDGDETLTNNLRINDFPTSILVGRDGLIKAVHVGYFSPEAIEDEIGPLIK